MADDTKVIDLEGWKKRRNPVPTEGLEAGVRRVLDRIQNGEIKGYVIVGINNDKTAFLSMNGDLTYIDVLWLSEELRENSRAE